MTTLTNTSGLTGFVGISPTVGGVIITGSDVTTEFSDFDFVPGSIIEINANPLPNGSNDFQPFIGYTGTIADITAQNILDINAGTEFANFLNVPGAFTFTLEQVDNPVFIETAFSTTGQLSAFGSFYDMQGNKSSGELNFSADFAGMTEAEVLALVSSQNNFVASWSLNAVATDTSVPEASIGFFSLAIICLAIFAKLKR